MSTADELHERIFGFVPPKAGTAYERLAAVVLVELGWESVKHETRLRPGGRRAEQRLDITATHPNGSIRRLLVECKDWNKEVGKGTMGDPLHQLLLGGHRPTGSIEHRILLGRPEFF